MQQLEQLEYEAAAAAFERAAKSDALNNEERARVLVRLANTRNDLRDRTRASAHLEQAVLLDPAVPAPSDASPELLQMLEEARAARPTGPPPAAREPPPSDALSPAPDAGAPADVQEFVAPVEQPESEDGLSVLVVTGAATGGLGVLALVGGATTWGAGVLLAGQAEKASDMRTGQQIADQSAAVQISGQVVAGVGGLTMLVGGALLLAGLLVE